MRALQFSTRRIFGLTALAAILLALGHVFQLFWWGTLVLFGPLFLIIALWNSIPSMCRTALVIAYVAYFAWLLTPDIQ